MYWTLVNEDTFSMTVSGGTLYNKAVSHSGIALCFVPSQTAVAVSLSSNAIPVPIL